MSFLEVCDLYHKEFEHATTNEMREQAHRSFVKALAAFQTVPRAQLAEENERRLNLRIRYCQEQKPFINYFYELEIPVYPEVTELSVSCVRVITDPEYLKEKYPFFASLPPRFKSLRNFLYENQFTPSRMRDSLYLFQSFNSVKAFQRCRFDDDTRKRAALRKAKDIFRSLQSRLGGCLDLDQDYEAYRSFSTDENFAMLRLFPTEEDDVIKHFTNVHGGYIYFVYILYNIVSALHSIWYRAEEGRLIEYNRPICIYDEVWYTDDTGAEYDRDGLFIRNSYIRNRALWNIQPMNPDEYSLHRRTHPPPEQSYTDNLWHGL